jgi:CBS domain-containing protein
MSVGKNAVPLIALDAVAIDTEATGLDPRKARIVEIGAVRLAGERIKPEAPFRQLVRPGIPIPADAVRIHGIDDAGLAGAPEFSEVWPQFAEYLADDVLIGHTIGFDIALLRRELERIGKRWSARPALDTRLLAQIAEPELAGYSLEQLAVWLGIDITGRHSALGDASATAKIFCALIPKLRERGIRTLAEATRACDSLLESPGQQYPSGWARPTSTNTKLLPERTAERFDTYLYRRRVGTLMTPAQSIAADAPIGTALEMMTREKISSLFIFLEKGDIAERRPEHSGIITERDILRAIGTHGPAALALPVGKAMSRPLSSVSADALAYLAIGRMNRQGFRHLGVTDDLGQVVGALSARDLLRLRAEAAVELGDEIDEAKETAELARAWAKLAPICADLLREGLTAKEVASVISQQLEQLTRRAAILSEIWMKETGHGDPPCPYAFVVLGSAGRGESLLAMDQDNALIFEDGANADADRWFQTMAEHTADILHTVGVPYCQGGVMAKNAPWRGSASIWRKRVNDWIERSDPQDLLSVDIFFDLHGVHGLVALAEALWRDAFDAAQGNVGFAKLLIEVAGTVEPGRTWFGGFRTVQGRIDLKKAGLFGLVTAARSLAICHHVVQRSTPVRLESVKILMQRSTEDLDALVEAHGVFLDLILRQQLVDIESGRSPSNAVEVKRLSRQERDRLRSALAAVEYLDEIARDLLFQA